MHFYSSEGLYDQLFTIYEAEDQVFAESSKFKFAFRDFKPTEVNKTSTCYISNNSTLTTPISYSNTTFQSSLDTFSYNSGSHTIHDVLLDNSRNLWIATNQGLVLTKKEIKESYLPNKTITSVLQDHEGNIWFSTLGEGIFMKPVMGFYWIYQRDQLSNPIHSLALSGDSLLAGTSQGSFLVISLTDYSIQEYFLSNSASSNKVRTIYKDKNGKIWCGTDRGIYIYNNNNSKRLNTFPIKSFTVDSSDNLFFASTSGIIKINSLSQKVLQISSDRTTAIACFKDSLIFGSLNGIHSTSSDYNFLNNERITTIFCEKKRDFFGTYGDGLFIRMDSSLLHLSAKDYLPGNVVKGFTKSGENSYWIATNKGLSRIALADNFPGGISAVTFTSKHGLPSEDIHAVAVSGRTVFFATDRGVTSFISGSFKNEENIPKIYITESFVNNLPLELSPQASLESDKNNVRFEFTAVSLSSLGDVQYEYKLKGFDQEWSRALTNYADYRNLKPGKYHFYVRAISKFGFKSDPAKVSFLIVPHFTDSILFKSFMAIIFLSMFLLAGLIIWKNQKNKHDQKLRLLRLEQHALATQMNPHFIFNCLNSIQQFILSSDKLAANKYLTSFAVLIRSFLENGKKSMISLEEEIKTLQLYTQLENFRINNKIEINIYKPDTDLSRQHIPSMLIQPLVENSILHGLIPLNLTERKPRLDIAFELEKDQVEIIIKDNGIGRKKAMAINAEKSGHNSTAVRNIMERIRILNKMKGFKGEFSIEDLPEINGIPQGTIARVKLKINFYGKDTDGNY